MIKLPTTTWIELYSELSQYTEARAFPHRNPYNDEGSRREYTEDDFVKIVNEVEESKDGFPQFHLTKPRYKDVKVEVSADGEGNYGGVLFLSEMENV